MKFLCALVAVSLSSQIYAANLVLSVLQSERKGERDCGLVGSVNQIDARTAMIVSQDGRCICQIDQNLGVVDSASLVSSNGPSTFICESEFDPIGDFGRSTEILVGPNPRMTAQSFRILGNVR